MQGSFRYKTGDTKLYTNLMISGLESFKFDHTVSVEKRLYDFKKNVIHRGIKPDQ